MTMLKVELENRTEQEISDEMFQDLAEKIAADEGIATPRIIALLLVTSDIIRELNRSWRGRNTATDVLAFPFGFPAAEILGDIIIDIETACHQKCDRSLDGELQILFIHGLLHLLGYDHITGRDAELMKKKENRYIRYIKE